MQVWNKAREHGKAGMEEAGYKGRVTHKGLTGHSLVQVREKEADRYRLYKRYAG